MSELEVILISIKADEMFATLLLIRKVFFIPPPIFQATTISIPRLDHG